MTATAVRSIPKPTSKDRVLSAQEEAIESGSMALAGVLLPAPVSLAVVKVIRSNANDVGD